MVVHIDESELHRTAKIFMDSGQAASYEAAIAKLETFGLNILVGSDVARSAAHQTALLTLVNLTRRSLLGGVLVAGLPDAPSYSPMAPGVSLLTAVLNVGGKVGEAVPSRPTVVIGDATQAPTSLAWRITWEGWRGGVIPARRNERLAEDTLNTLAPILAAAVAAAEVFSFLAADNPMAGRRAAGLSLWYPGRDWLALDTSEPPVHYLPAALWFLGLGNLGQAFAWCLASLPYAQPKDVALILQDFDRLSKSNESTSLLSFLPDVGAPKTRVVAGWLEARGFVTTIEERRFGSAIRRADAEPGVLLCGVDNALARASMGDAGFDLIVEAGLGGGPQAFRSIGVHVFPASRRPAEIWAAQVGQNDVNYEEQPAYRQLKREGMEACGLARLASRTVGVPFVGLIAACLVFSELLRRLNGGIAMEVVATSAANLANMEIVEMAATPYPNSCRSAIVDGLRSPLD